MRRLLHAPVTTTTVATPLAPILILILALVLAHGLNAEPLSKSKSLEATTLTVTVDPPTVGLAETLRYSLVIEAPVNLDVEFEAVADRLGSFWIQGRQPLGPVNIGSGQRQWQRVYTLEAEVAGRQVIPGLAVRLMPALAVAMESCRRSRDCDPQTPNPLNASVATLQGDAIEVEVTSVLPAGAVITKIKDIAPPLEWPVEPRPPLQRLWPWLGAVAVALVAFWLWSRLRSRQPAVSVRSPEPQPDATALAALDELESQHRAGNSLSADAFCLRLTAIVRDYVEARYGTRLHARTTEELDSALASDEPTLAVRRDDLRGLFGFGDRVKFGRYSAAPDEMNRALFDVRGFVQQTAASKESLPA